MTRINDGSNFRTENFYLLCLQLDFGIRRKGPSQSWQLGRTDFGGRLLGIPPIGAFQSLSRECHSENCTSIPLRAQKWSRLEDSWRRRTGIQPRSNSWIQSLSDLWEYPTSLSLLHWTFTLSIQRNFRLRMRVDDLNESSLVSSYLMTNGYYSVNCRVRRLRKEWGVCVGREWFSYGFTRGMMVSV